MGAKSYYFEDNQIKPMGDIPEESSADGRFEDIQNDLLKDSTILIIDDNPINLTVAHKTLAKFGAKTVKALSGVEGIKAFQKNSVQLILMDLHMPFMDGFETTERIREEASLNKETQIVAMTAQRASDVFDRVEASAMTETISKPFEPQELYQKLKQYLVSEGT